ncbi:MAG: hypothetical protein A2284_05565 [Deltaproteobacteria bacterium RIFOXYA12_FULL_61_11]|nr:MAG: hypothetical protein A2284_05565 [Deltaproteobacteria bacterium RIFOXYA12_FULL_61_11]
MTATDDSLFSSYREALLEHLFVADVLRELWRNGVRRVKPQVDDGYDLLLEVGDVVRIQLKSSAEGAKTAKQTISLNLAAKPSGCVVWMKFDPVTLKLGPYWWFGGAPGRPLPDIQGFEVARHAKGNAQGVKLERPNQRVVPRSKFEVLNTMEQLVGRLFGTALPSERQARTAMRIAR